MGKKEKTKWKKRGKNNKSFEHPGAA